ncbi:MAG: M23 family metallopeptidase [Actinobacteria bacterium]|nr:M23 family metallopeptidase [Actinomycetota bacterium]
MSRHAQPTRPLLLAQGWGAALALAAIALVAPARPAGGASPASAPAWVLGDALEPGGDVPPGAVVYQPPVDAPVSDPFRPPSTPYGAGNRGIEYRTAPGTPVRAAADGRVTFAGTVAGAVWVTILHADGVRTSYGPLATRSVRSGQPVRRGDPLGTSGAVLHVGARRGDTYLDPATLWSGRRQAVLVPLDGAGPVSSPAGADVGTATEAEGFAPDWASVSRSAGARVVRRTGDGSAAMAFPRGRLPQ